MIFLIIWFMQKNVTVSLILLAALIIGVAISSAIGRAMSVKHIEYCTVSFLIPLGCIAALALAAIGIHNADKPDALTVDEIIVLIFQTLPAYIGISIILSRVIYKIAKGKYCTFPVNAECVGVSKRHVNGKGRHRTYTTAGIFRFEFDGEEHTVMEDTYTFTNSPKEFEYHTININPNDPEDIYFPNAMGDITNFLTGLVFIIFDIVFWAGFFIVNS